MTLWQWSRVGRVCIVGALTLLAVTPSSRAQEARFEVGVRLGPFDRAWNAASPEAKEAALPLVEGAVRAFFSLSLSEVGRQLDLARHRLDGKQWSARWFDALTVQPESRVLQPGQSLGLVFGKLYSSRERVGAEAQVLVSARHVERGWHRATLLKVERALALAADGRPTEVPWRLQAGDWNLTLRLIHEGKVARQWNDVISVSRDAAQRVAALRSMSAQITVRNDQTSWPDLYHATARSLLNRCEQVVEGYVPELSFAVVAGLDRAESLLQRAARFSQGNAEALSLGVGEQWWVIPDGKKTSVLRMWIPERVDEETVLVVGVHGLGGTENLFFESYGAGRIVELCRERNWICVATRQPLLGGMPIDRVVSLLRRFLPFDERGVMIVGHSKGVSESLAGVRNAPETFAGAAFIGGGAMGAPKSGTKTRFWVGAGAKDFGLRPARALHRRLQSSGAVSQWLEIPRTEHHTAVTDALPHVFEFFDEILAVPESSRL